MKSNLQRRIRRAWLAKKERIAEKKRKKAEAAEAAKKGKFGKKKRTTAPAPAATVVNPPTSTKPAASKDASPAK